MRSHAETSSLVGGLGDGQQGLVGGFFVLFPFFNFYLKKKAKRLVGVKWGGGLLEASFF